MVGKDILLNLPFGILSNQEFHGVWIKNKGFESVGLKAGCLAVVVSMEVVNGDLVAVNEIETDLVVIGFYEMDLGFICLENCLSEVEVFNPYEIEILGKIVGFCFPTSDLSNRYSVTPILAKQIH